MENKPKKSKALIITIILIVLLILVGYFLLRNKDSVGVKTSSSIAKIFSPLGTSSNSKKLTTTNEKLTAKAGEDLNKGDKVYVYSLDGNNNPTVMRVNSKNSNVWGIALRDIKMGDIGEFSGGDGSFWGTIKDFIGGIFGKDPNDGQCNNGATNPTLCTTIGGICINSAINPPLCTNFNTNVFPIVTITANPTFVTKGGSSTISWESENAESCNAGDGNGTGTTGSFSTGILNASRLYTVTCTGTNGTGSDNVSVIVMANNQCPNTATNPPECTTIGGKCINNAINPPECTENPTECTNGTDNFPLCTTIGGKCINNAVNPPECTDNGGYDFPSVTVTANPTTVSSGKKSTISWESENAISCKESGGRGGTLVKGTFETEELYKSTAYTVTCIGKGANGIASGTTFVYVNPEIIDPKPECSDGVDNDDVDTFADVLDPECHSDGNVTNEASYDGTWYSEKISWGGYRECADKLDNDGDGLVDIKDPGCHTDNIALDKPGSDTTGAESYNPSTYVPTRSELGSMPPLDGDKQCNDGIDNDGKGGIDEDDVDCHIGGVKTGKYVPTHDSELNPPTQCDDTLDNDGDGKVDTQDSGCHTDYDASNSDTYKDTLNDESKTKPVEVAEENKCLLIEQNPLTFTPEEKARLETLLRKFYLISSSLRTSEDIATIYSDIDQQNSFIKQIGELTKQCYLDVNDRVGFNSFCSRNKSLCEKPRAPMAADNYSIEFESKNNDSYADRYYTAKQNLTLRRGNPWYPEVPKGGFGGTFPYTENNAYSGESRIAPSDNSGSAPKNNITLGYMDYTWLEGNENGVYKNGIGPGCKAVSGYYYGVMTNGISCDIYNYPNKVDANNTKVFNNCYYINTKIYGNKSAPPEEGPLSNGCKWKDGVDLGNTERILNIW